MAITDVVTSLSQVGYKEKEEAVIFARGGVVMDSE